MVRSEPIPKARDIFFPKCVGIGGLGKSGIHPKLNLNNLGWSDVTKGSTEEGFHEVFLSMYSFQLYVWVGMFSLPATRVTVTFLVGELSSCYSVGVHLNVSGCYVSFLRVKRMICWHPQKCELMPKTCKQWPEPFIFDFINGNFRTQLYVWNMTSRYEDLFSSTKRPAMSQGLF